MWIQYCVPGWRCDTLASAIEIGGGVEVLETEFQQEYSEEEGFFVSEYVVQVHHVGAKIPSTGGEN